MNEDQAGSLNPTPQPQEPDGLEESASIPFLEQARNIERDMFSVMTTQVRLAIIQIALGLLSILTAFILAMLQ